MSGQPINISRLVKWALIAILAAMAVGVGLWALIANFLHRIMGG